MNKDGIEKRLTNNAPQYIRNVTQQKLDYDNKVVYDLFLKWMKAI
jgi:hypothetical protein